MKTRIRSLIAVAAILVMATGCASSGALNPAQQTEGKIAFHARQVIMMADTALTAVDILTEQRLALAGADTAKQERVKAEARTVIGVFKQIGDGGQKLATVLTAVDQATSAIDRSQGLLTAQGILQGLNRLVTDGTIVVGDDAARGQIMRLFGNVSDLLIQLAFVLPKPAP